MSVFTSLFFINVYSASILNCHNIMDLTYSNCLIRDFKEKLKMVFVLHFVSLLLGSILTCDLDFSVKWQTYYDYRPESIRGGKDIVLKPGFDFSQNVKTSAFLQRQLSVENKDLGGLIFEQVMKKMCEDDFLKTFR